MWVSEVLSHDDLVLAHPDFFLIHQCLKKIWLHTLKGRLRIRNVILCLGVKVGGRVQVSCSFYFSALLKVERYKEAAWAPHMSRSMLEVLQSISFRFKKMEPRQMDMHMTPFFCVFHGIELYSQFLTSCSISIQSVLGLLIQGNPRLPGWGGQACLPPHYFVSWGLCPWAHLSMGRLVLLCASITCHDFYFWSFELRFPG